MAGSVRSAVCWVLTGVHSVVGPTAKAGEGKDGWRVDVSYPEDRQQAERLLQGEAGETAEAATK